MSANAVAGEKKGHGCFFYGCLTTVILIVVAALGIWWGIRALKNLAIQYTSDTPASIETVTLSPRAAADLDERIETFAQAMREDRPGRLSLTADEINSKIAESAEFAQMGGRARIRIEGDRVTADLSIPTDKLGLPGRHLNGTAKIRVGLQAGRLLVFLDEIQVKGNALPEMLMKDLRTKNLAEDALKDPDTAATLAKLKSLAVQNGTITVEK